MKRGQRSTEVKVGILVLVGILLLFYMTLRIGQMERIKGNPYFALFPSVSGLAKGAPVEVAGVVVGKVVEIGLEGNKAKVKMVISDQVELYRDASAVLRTHGALGDKFIEVDPGDPSAGPLPPEGYIARTRATPDLDQLFLSVQRTAEGFAQMGEALKELMGEEETREAIRELVFNLRDSSRELKVFLTENREGLDRTVANLERFSRELPPLVAKASDTLDRLQIAFSSLEEIGRDLQEGKGTLGKLLRDETLYVEMKEAIGEFRLMAKRVNEGEGTLGKLLQDETLYSDMKAAVAEFRLMGERINRGEGTLGKLLTDEGLYRQAEQTLKKVERAAEGVEEQTPITVLGTAAGLIF